MKHFCPKCMEYKGEADVEFSKSEKDNWFIRCKKCQYVIA